jgi:hypothetical protein
MALTGLAQSLQSFIWGVCVDWLGSHFCRLSGGYVLTGLAVTSVVYLRVCVDWLGTVTSIKRSLIVVHLGLCVDWIGTVTSIKVDCLITVNSVVYLGVWGLTGFTQSLQSCIWGVWGLTGLTQLLQSFILGGMVLEWLDKVISVVYLGGMR